MHCAGRALPVQLIASLAVIPGALSANRCRGRVASARVVRGARRSRGVGWLDVSVAKPGATLSAPGPSGAVEVRVAVAAI